MQLGTGSGLSIGTGGTMLRATGPRSRVKVRAWVRDRGQSMGQGRRTERGLGTEGRAWVWDTGQKDEECTSASGEDPLGPEAAGGGKKAHMMAEVLRRWESPG